VLIPRVIMLTHCFQVAPAYDSNGTGFHDFESSTIQSDPLLPLVAEITNIAAADIVFDFLSILAIGRDAAAADAKQGRDEL
jgi:triphosphoribosyl-dephospho-CoA synthetase